MKNKMRFLPLVLFIHFVTLPSFASPLATSIVEKAENQIRGKDFKARMRMKVVRGSDERTMEVRIWSVTTEMTLIKILNPVKDRFGGNLRSGTSLWQYLPNVDRVIRIPASLMGQPWMGSDFSNDDLVKASSWSRDYTHQIVGEATDEGQKVVKIECTPKKDAPVVWGKLVLFLRKSDAALMKEEFYNERQEMVKYMKGSKFKTSGSHTVPTMLAMLTPKKPDHQTLIEYLEFKFDSQVPKDIFTQEYLKKKIAN